MSSFFSSQKLIIVGEGYSLEDLKPKLEEGGVLSGRSIFQPVSLAWEILKRHEAFAPAPASATLKEEFFRLLLDHPSIRERFPLLSELKQKPGFWRKLETSIESAQFSAAHSEERAVQLERLLSMESGRVAVRQASLRKEVLALLDAWESWCGEAHRADEARALQLASEILSENPLPQTLAFRSAEFRSVSAAEPLIEHFLGEISRKIGLDRPSIPNQFHSEGLGGIEAELWHTVEDAAERLADLLVQRFEEGESALKQVILIPDQDLSVRVALRRVLQERGIREWDPRDPLELKLSEGLKKVFEVFELCLSGFERNRLMAFLKSMGVLSDSSLSRLHFKLCELGLRQGWRGAEPLLKELGVLEHLEQVAREGATRQSWERWALFHRTQLKGVLEPRVQAWLDSLTESLGADLEALGLVAERWSLSEYWERLRSRVERSRLPPHRSRPSEGVRILRMSQAHPETEEFQNCRVYLMGLSSRWLSTLVRGDFYLRAQERELLGLEFGLRTSFSEKQARIQSLRSWLSAASFITVLDYQFEMDGGEREDPALAWHELGLELSFLAKGAHPRQLGSYSLSKQARAREVRLPSIIGDDSSVEMTATDLEGISRCPFFAVVFSRWRAKNPDDPDLEFWPTTQGVLLHAAVERLTRTLGEMGTGEPLESIVKGAWADLERRGQLKGWVPSPQIRAQLERRCSEVLAVFREKELEFRKLSGARLLVAEEEAKLHWEYDFEGVHYRIRGKADRIDEHPDGLWVVDYKASSQDLKGSDILNLGYRLQLPFYAIASQSRFGKPVLGVQLVELTRDGRRSIGLFPKKWNGKTPGSLSQVRSNSSSLFDQDPEEVWDALARKAQERLRDFVLGQGDSQPVMGAKECQRCRARSVCGQARREWVEGEE